MKLQGTLKLVSTLGAIVLGAVLALPANAAELGRSCGGDYRW